MKTFFPSHTEKPTPKFNHNNNFNIHNIINELNYNKPNFGMCEVFLSEGSNSLLSKSSGMISPGGASPRFKCRKKNSKIDKEPIYKCHKCGKKYRWKSTLRRHEHFECGDKAPLHSCPYCSYKSKQRGNLGVHVRKHHGHLPQLENLRRRSLECLWKTTAEGGGNSSSNNNLYEDEGDIDEDDEEEEENYSSDDNESSDVRSKYQNLLNYYINVLFQRRKENF